MKKTHITHTPEETQEVATELVASLSRNVVTLSGDLGAGKTTFVQGVAKTIGLTSRIMSPTFIIMRSYKLDGKWKALYHVDLYRLHDEKEVSDIGLLDIMKDPENLVMIEWPEKMGSLLPQDRVHITFTQHDEQTREIIVNYE